MHEVIASYHLATKSSTLAEVLANALPGKNQHLISHWLAIAIHRQYVAM